MAEILVVANQKGGVGKSTTAHAIGSWLFKNGYKVLYVDLDSQCNLTYTLEGKSEKVSVFEILQGTARVDEGIQNTTTGDLISGSEQLSGSDRELNGDGAELKLKQTLEPIVQNYDYIIIDTPPALGILTINAFTAADRVIIPAQADIYSLQGIGQLYRTIKAVQEHTNPDLKIAGILITRYNGRTILSRDLSELINQTAEQLNTKVFESKIRESIVIKEAQASNKSIFEYAADSNPAKDYDSFMKELLKDIQI